MEITRIRSGHVDPAAIEAVMPELLDFDPIPDEARHSLCPA
ncbi:hypothetical protein [Brevibacterium linens]